MVFFNFPKKYVLDYRRILEDVGVPKGEVDDCMAWAFGDDWKSLSPHRESMVRWNQRHGAIFPIKRTDIIRDTLKKIGVAYMGTKDGSFINVGSLYDLNESEKRFRKAIVKSFVLEDITDLNEMMDCISWGLNYDKELLRCHTYQFWPDAFRANAGIEVTSQDSIEKCIRLLARVWKSKKKFVVIKGMSN